MHKRDQNKLLEAGFTLLDAKTGNEGHEIWQKTPQRRNWHILHKGIKTKAELKRIMQKLLEQDNVIDLYYSVGGIYNRDVSDKIFGIQAYENLLDVIDYLDSKGFTPVQVSAQIKLQNKGYSLDFSSGALKDRDKIMSLIDKYLK